MGNIFSTPPSRSLKTEKPLPELQPVHKGFNPTRQDVQVAVHILMGLRLQAEPGHLPSELALSILAHADYRPRIMSSKAKMVHYKSRTEYDVGTEHQPWYLMTPMLPPDFRRARSITLQVLSDHHRINRLNLQVGANSPDGTLERDHTWYEMCILRPLRRSESSIARFVHCGGVVHQEPGGVVQEPWDPRIRTGDAESDMWKCDEWLGVYHDGTEPWVIRHNDRVSDRSPGELTGTNEISFQCFPHRVCETWQVDWPPAGNTSDVENSRSFQDGEGFLSALMPGDMVVFWAAAEEPALGITLLEAVIEILYDA